MEGSPTRLPLVWRVRLAARLFSCAAVAALFVEGVAIRADGGSSGTPGAVGDLVALGLFCLVFAALVLQGFDDVARAPTRTRLALTVLLILTAAVVVVRTETLGTRAVPFFVVAAVSATWGRRVLATITLGVLVVEAVRLLTSGEMPAQVLVLCIALVVFAAAMRSVVALTDLCRELDDARGGAAEAAVAAERIRFARDLHDLLGHRLTVMSVKLRVLDRTLTRSPEAARAEVAELSTLVASALHELRAAVRGYRSDDLGELVGGLEKALRSAGVEPDVEITDPGVVGGSSPVLQMVLKEGVTNVLRHSGASRCTIRLVPRGARLALTVRDDGQARPGVDAPRGSGLCGAAERVLAVGGSFSHGPVEPHGYEVRAEVPRQSRIARDVAPAAPAVPVASTAATTGPARGIGEGGS